jgi:hypothetical protein
MSRSLRALLATSAASLAFCCAVPAHAECRGIWTKMCTGDRSGITSDPDAWIPPIDPAEEKLRADVQTYDRAMGWIFEVSATIEPFLGLPWPADEQVLSRRVDDVLARIWPEVSSNALEADLLRRQAGYYEIQIDRLGQQVASQRETLERAATHLPDRRAQLVRTEAQLAGTRQREAEVTALAVALLNDRRSEQSAAATLLAFAPRPGVTAAALAPAPRIVHLPGARPMPSVPTSAGPTAFAVEATPPSQYAKLTLSLPGPNAPLDVKLAVLQSAGTGLQQDMNEVRSLAVRVPARRAELASLTEEARNLGQQVAPLREEFRRIDDGIARATAQMQFSVANQQTANMRIFTEILVDMGLDAATGQMRRVVDGIAGSEGLSARMPAGGSRGVLDFARRGGHMALPVAGYAQQWEAFTQVQEQTLDVLDRAEGFILSAAQLSASGSPQEMERQLERVFASVKWQTFEYVKLTGFGGLPDGEDKSLIEEVFERYLAKRRELETADE